MLGLKLIYVSKKGPRDGGKMDGVKVTHNGNTLSLSIWVWVFLLADASFKCIFLKENVWILIKISLKFGSVGQIDNTPALVKKNGLAWNRQQAISWTNDGLLYITDSYTVECCYNTFQYSKILHNWLQKLRQNMN